MLLTELIHPQILSAIAGAGHGSRILIADGNYPLSTGSNPAATRVYLNLSPGLLKIEDILKAILSAVVVESADVMKPAEGPEPPIFNTFRKLLPSSISLNQRERFNFYDFASEKELCLAIASGDQTLYGNIVLTIGVRKPGQ